MNPPKKEQINTPIFVVGCILLVAVLVAFFWAFSLGDLTPARYYLLQFIFPIGAAIASWCFTGGLNVEGRIKSLGVSAVGGFAVWVLTLLTLKPVIPNRVDMVEAIRMEIVGIRGSWEVMIREYENLETAKNVYNRAPDAGRRILALGDHPLLGKRIDQYEWATYAFYMAADAAFRLNSTNKYFEYIAKAHRYATETKKLLLEADNSASGKPHDGYMQDLQVEIHRCYDRERTAYLEVMILAIRQHVEKIDQSDQIHEIWNNIDKVRLAELEVDPKFTPYVKDIIKL